MEAERRYMRFHHLLFVLLATLLHARVAIANDQPTCNSAFNPVIPIITGLDNDSKSMGFALTVVSVDVLQIGAPGRHIPAKVSLISETETFPLASFDGKYVASVPTGWYTLKAEAEGYSTRNSKVEIRGGRRELTIYVSSQESKDFFRVGDSIVPFQALENFQAIVFGYSVPSRESVFQYLLSKEFQDLHLDLKVEFPHPEHISWRFPAEGNVFLTATSGIDVNWPKTVALLRKALQTKFTAADVRVGVAIDVGHGGFQSFDRRFFIKFSQEVTKKQEEDWIKSSDVNGRILETFENSIHWIEFGGDDFRANLCVIEKAFADGLLEIGEPDLIFEIHQSAFPLPILWPNDPNYATYQLQTGVPTPMNVGPHTIQKVRQAWELLSKWTGHFRPMSSNIVLGFLDTGINMEVADMGCGSVKSYVDTANITENCLLPRCSGGATGGCAPDTCFSESDADLHGIGVFGIATACANNRRDVAGISPGPLFFSVIAKIGGGIAVPQSLYVQVLRWMVGEVLCSPSGGCARRVLIPARVINVSNNARQVLWNGGPPPVLHSVFKNLALNHRAILVYAAPNHGFDISDTADGAGGFARDDYVVSVGNITAENVLSTTELRLATKSCWEKASDWGGVTVYAIGHNAPTINKYCLSSAPPLLNTPVPGARCPDRETAVCTFGGTSSATPTVSAAIALMLTANPALGVFRIKEILRATADITNLKTTELGLTPSPTPSTVANIYGGTGVINVCRAVEQSIADTGAPVPRRPGGYSYCD